ncbi:MAG: MotA/TolQ/ExbB proton channel family protein [bacterium]
MWLFEYSLRGWQTLVTQGGLIIYILAAASVVGLAIILEKVIRLRKTKVFTESAAVDLLLAVKSGDSRKISEAKRNSPLPMADIISSAQLVKELPKEDMLSEMTAVASMHIRNLSERIKLLGILASISPLLGLLGTVFGMIKAMGEVSHGAGADPLIVGQGISQALMTTAVGLSVGIPLLVIHSLLKDRINRFASEFEEFAHEVMKTFYYPESVILETPQYDDFETSEGDSSEEQSL